MKTILSTINYQNNDNRAFAEKLNGPEWKLQICKCDEILEANIFDQNIAFGSKTSKL